jgi:hypothetical protein
MCGVSRKYIVNPREFAPFAVGTNDILIESVKDVSGIIR